MIQRVLRDKFIKNNIVFFVGSIITAVLNYLYHPIMVRMMSVEDFGEVATVMSITYLMGIFLMICGTISINIVSNHKHHGSTAYVSLLSRIFALALPIVVVYAIGIVVISPILKNVLHFDSVLPFLPLALILSVDVVNTFYGAYLRGSERFLVVSISNIISSASRVIFGVILVYMGLRVCGAISALAIATFLSLMYAMYKTRGEFRLSLDEKAEITPEIRKEAAYGMLILFSFGYVTFLYASDVLFMKFFFDPETAGLYSGIAMIARIIFFATGSVAGVLMPTIKIRAEKKENRTILKKALWITMCIAMSIFAFFFIMPAWIVTIMIGAQYTVLAETLPLIGMYMVMVSLVNVLYTYYIALRERRLICASVVGFTVTIGLIMLFHESIKAVVWSYIIGSFMTVVTLGMYKIIHGDKRDELR